MYEIVYFFFAGQNGNEVPYSRERNLGSGWILPSDSGSSSDQPTKSTDDADAIDSVADDKSKKSVKSSSVEDGKE